MGLKIFLQDKLVDEKDAKISVFDHGLLYGDGVFEGIRAYNSKVFKLKEHIERLYSSANAIALKIPFNKSEIIEKILLTIRANELKDAYIRLIITRGVGDLGLDPNKTSFPTLIIIASKIMLYPEKYYQNGLEIITTSTRRNSPDVLNPKIKSLNYLNNILAKIEVHNTTAVEGLMLNSNGYVAECTGENIFVVKNNVLLTPPGYIGALEGITRNTVIELATKLGYITKEAVFTRFEIYNSDECFLTGTAAEIVPVTKIDNRTIGNGKPGIITLQLMKEFKELVKKEGVEIYKSDS